MIVCASEQQPSISDASLVPAAGWVGNLNLAFQPRFDAQHQLQRTVLQFEHLGPLRIQKALYPDGPKCCQAVIIHPPGGIASGDRLAISIDVGEAAQAVVTTPSATKWYGAFDQIAASQRIHMSVKGHLQWLPAETIVYDGAIVHSSVNLDVSSKGSFLGWDTLIYGRQGSGERYLRGMFDQTVRLSLDREVVWIDRLRLMGADPLFDSPVGFQGHHALATCWVVTPENAPVSDECLDELRVFSTCMAFTRLHPRVLVGRLLGAPIELRTQLEVTWHWLNKYLLKQTIAAPRLWAT